MKVKNKKKNSFLAHSLFLAQVLKSFIKTFCIVFCTTQLSPIKIIVFLNVQNKELYEKFLFILIRCWINHFNDPRVQNPKFANFG